MKKVLKSNIFLLIVAAIIFGGLGVFATSQIMSSQITYNNTTLDLVLDDLYDKVENSSPNVSTFTGTIHINATEQGATVYHESYVDIDTSNYDNLKIVVTYIDEDHTTCNVKADNTVLENIDGEGTYNIDVSSYSKVRIYYRQDVGWDYLDGTYELSN